MSDLNRNELEVLRVLWADGEQKPADIQACFEWEIENPTLRSVLVGLVDKQLVTRKKVGKAFFYRAKARRRSQFSRVMRRMADVFTGGSTGELIMQLLKDQKLSPEEVEELQRIAGQKAEELDH